MTRGEGSGRGVHAPGARGRRLDADARREQILACAVRLFDRRPYAEVSTTDVAREAGVARALVNHYFGTKKGLYLEVVRVLVTIPDVAVAQLPEGPPQVRADAGVAWFLDAVSRHSGAWLAATSGTGLHRDPDVERILAEADEVAAGRILAALGLDAPGPRHEELLAMVRAYSGFATGAAREWLLRGTLSREQVHGLLADALVTLVTRTIPRVAGEAAGAAADAGRVSSLPAP